MAGKEDKFDLESQDELLGLCKYCLLASECVFPREKGRPIHFCDEFEGGGPKETSSPEASVRETRGTESPEELEEELIGLCRNCALRHTCTFPKPEGGVWHCEEYE